MSQRMTHVGSLVGGLCLVASFAGCEQSEEPAGDVDQPSPIDWQSQGALMTAPSKSPRTIAAMMFDIGGRRRPNATQRS